jgi:multiple sugar transport system ATP-binding protein
MTLAPVELVPGDGSYATVRLGNGAHVETRVEREALPRGGPLQLGLRPESVRVSANGTATTSAKVDLVERLGERTLVYARLADGLAITAEDEGNSRVNLGDVVELQVSGASAHLFGPDGTAHHASEGSA